MITNTEIDTTPTPIFTSVGNAAVNLMIFCNTNDTLQAKVTVAVVPIAVVSTVSSLGL